MLLVIDVGNTNIVLGLYKENKLVNFWRLFTGSHRTSDEIGTFMRATMERTGIDLSEIRDCIMASVVPDIMYSIIHGLKKYFNLDPMIVSHKMKMRLNLEKIGGELGADRIVNGEAVLIKYGGPCIVVDYGTATKYDVVDASGLFITGVTAPGIRICADALFEKTALLGKVEIVMPDSIVATNTMNSIQAGIVYGQIGQTEYIVKNLIDALKIDNMKVIATGGLSSIVARGTQVFDSIDPMLTLEGLKILYDENK